MFLFFIELDKIEVWKMVVRK